MPDAPLEMKTSAARVAPRLKVQMLSARASCLTLTLPAFSSSLRAWPVALLWPKRSVMIFPVERSITSKMLLPVGFTMYRGASGGAIIFGFW